MSDPKGFVLIANADTRLRLIREAAKDRESVTIWTKERATIVHATMSGFDYNRQKFEVEFAPETPTADIDTVVNEAGIFCSVLLPRVTIFFRCSLSKHESGKPRVEFNIPEQIFKQQRRKYARYDCLSDPSIWLSHEDPQHPERIIKRKLSDLSAGGASVILHYGEERYYHTQQRFNQIKVRAGTVALECWAVVRHLRVLGPTETIGGSLLGIEFMNISDSDRRTLNTHLEELIRQQMGQVILEQNPIPPPKK